MALLGRDANIRFALALAILGALLVTSILVAVAIGPARIAVGDVWGVIGHHLGLITLSPVNALRDSIIWNSRLPRLLTAAAIGAGLAVSGAIVQSVTRNPLADPYLLGLSAGASTGAVLCFVIGFSALMPIGAFAGAMLALALALGLAGLSGSLTPTRTVLAGIAVTALMAATTSLMIFWTAVGDSYREVLSWLLGSIAGAGWWDAALAGISVAVVGALVLLRARLLDAFAFGDLTAATLGVDVGQVRWLMLAATALLTGVMVSIAGSIGFVGLILPHAVRLVYGTQHRALLPLSALAGAIFMVWADTLARTAFDPRELPVGIVTALIGAPVFMAILLRQRRLT